MPIRLYLVVVVVDLANTTVANSMFLCLCCCCRMDPEGCGAFLRQVPSCFSSKGRGEARGAEDATARTSKRWCGGVDTWLRRRRSPEVEAAQSCATVRDSESHETRRQGEDEKEKRHAG
jgi:hypothetical protein